MRTPDPAQSFESTDLTLTDPDDTVVLGSAPRQHGEYVPGDVRVIPVEVETTFVFEASGEADSFESDLAVLAAPEAVLLDAGDLAPIEEILLSLGVDTERIGIAPDATSAQWTRPTRLLVASGRLALRLSIEQGNSPEPFAALAVSNEESRGYARRMRERGFQYVVNQPVHSDVLRLLLQQTLFQGAHQRRALRYPVGRKVACRRGRQRQQATLVELSALGGRLHVGHPAALEAPITLRVRGGDRKVPLTLRGRVVRCERRASQVRRFALGVAWDLPTEAERQTLDDLLGSPARAALPGTSPAPETPRSEPGAPPARPTHRSAPTRPPRRPSDLKLPDRRRNPRARLEREIVALDTENRVCTTLVGCDISPQALRVERHEDLKAGLRLRIAIHTARGEEPLVLESCVVRDDGTRGVLLRFLELDDTLKTRVHRVTAELPQVGSGRPRRRISPRNAA